MANKAVDNTANEACDTVVTPTSTPVRTFQASIDVVSYEVKDTVRALAIYHGQFFLYTVCLTHMLLPVPPSSTCHRKNGSLLTKPMDSQRNKRSKVSLYFTSVVRNHEILSYCAMNENPATRSQSLSTII
jgi:hypothetical protein